MKKCNKCGLEKDESEFFKDKTRKDGLTSSCKACRKSYEMNYRKEHKDKLRSYGEEYRKTHKQQLAQNQKIYYESHKDILSERNKIYQRDRRKRNKDRLYLFKQPCVKCGDERPYVIDFHHIDPKNKLFNISTMGSRHTDVEIKDEIKKCVCLCRNCHQEFHYLYGNKPKHPVEDLDEYLGGVELLS